MIDFFQQSDIVWPFILSFLAGASTIVGGFLSFSMRWFEKRFLAFMMGLSAGVMLYVSFLELFPKALNELGFAKANVFFFVGMGIVFLLDFILPHHCYLGKGRRGAMQSPLLHAGFMAALGIAIHNFPEGLIVFFTSLEDITIGIPLFIAIALHNMPEGIAVALPIYHATGSRRKAIFWSFISGMTEPIGALTAYMLLSTNRVFLFLPHTLAIVAGIMVYISVDELLPLCFRQKEGHMPMVGVVFGMGIMAATLAFIS